MIQQAEMSIRPSFFFSQYNFIEHTHVQLIFTKDNLQQNENYNLKLTKKKEIFFATSRTRNIFF